MLIPQSVRDLVATGPFAHLSTTNPDGTPQVTVVWIGIEDDEFVIGHMGSGQKVRNIERAPRVALSFMGPQRRGILQEYVVAYGEARVTDGGGRQLLQDLAQVYLGKGSVFPFQNETNQGRVIRIRPERMTGIGPWVSRPA